MSDTLKEFVPIYTDDYYQQHYLETKDVLYAQVASRFYKSSWAKQAIIDASDHYIDTWAHTNKKPPFPTKEFTNKKSGRKALLYIPKKNWNDLWHVYLKIKQKQHNKDGVLYTVHNAAKELFFTEIDDDSAVKIFARNYRECKPLLEEAWGKYEAQQSKSQITKPRNNSFSPFINDSLARTLKMLPDERTLATIRDVQKQKERIDAIEAHLPKN